MRVAILAVLFTLSIRQAGHSQAFQSDSAALAWVRESPRRAAILAGCYRLNAPIKDSVNVRSAFRLTASRVKALGYHRPAHYWTDLPKSTDAETRPIWTPYSDDSLEIDLEPHSSNRPRYVLVVR